MSLSTRELNQLKKIVELANKMLANAESAGSAKSNGTKQKAAKKSSGKKASTRTRRSGAELVSFRKMLVAERKKGTSVAELCKQHGVSPAYVYQL